MFHPRNVYLKGTSPGPLNGGKKNFHQILLEKEDTQMPNNEVGLLSYTDGGTQELKIFSFG